MTTTKTTAQTTKTAVFPTTVKAVSKAAKKKPVIWIDPGHGQDNKRDGVFDSGAVNGKYREVDIALQWALTLKFVLTQAGFTVHMSRDDNTDSAPVGSRDNRATAAGCDLSVSIHCNAANGKATGVETFYRDAADRVLALIVQECALKATGLKDRGVKGEAASQHDKLAVLSFLPPACLLEIGFIDNPVDLAKMLSKNVRVLFAELFRDRLLAAYA